MVSDGLLLVIQSEVASYLSTRPMTFLRSSLTIMQLMVVLPGEVGVGVAAVLISLLCRKSVGVNVSIRSLVVFYLGLVLILTTATYRSHFLVPHVVLAVAPVGMIIAAVEVAQIWSGRRAWASVAAAELLLCTVLLSAYAQVGVGKTNTDLVAQYIMAEAAPTALIFLFPGAAGSSFNRSASRSLSQMDYPVVGRVFRSEFDEEYLRESSTEALRETLDSVRSACSAGRRVWSVWRQRDG